jgi:hypothetical protein
MNTILGQLWRLTLITALGLSGSMIAGLMIYGAAIFVPQEVGFAYVAYGISGGFIFAFYHVRGLSNTVIAALCASAVQFIGGSMWMPWISAATWSFGVNLAVVAMAFLFERKLATLGHWKFVVVGIVCGAMFVLLTLLVGMVMNVQAMPPSLFRENFMDGLWLGLALGLGVEIAESIIHSIDIQHHPRRSAY